MGEIADQLINGDDCESCGMPFEEPGDGYPRKCPACLAEERERLKQRQGSAVKRVILLLVLAGALTKASDVQWTRFRGKVKAVNYRASTLTLDSGGDLITVKIDDDVTIFSGKDPVQLNSVLIDNKVTLIYAPKALPPHEADEPPQGGVYLPAKR